MITHLIFDWGGVCTRGHLLRDFSRKLALACHGNAAEIEAIFRALEYPYETGKISPTKFWRVFKGQANCPLTVEQIREIFFNSYIIRPGMLDLLLSLRAKYKIILFTNNYQDLFAQLKKHYRLTKYFHRCFSSSGLKAKKPEPRAFSAVIKKLEIKPAQAIFIDDKEKNVLAAADFGFQTIQFENLAQMKKELKRSSPVTNKE
jgi:putative hydrolase of the HAD superfamily